MFFFAFVLSLVWTGTPESNMTQKVKIEPFCVPKLFKFRYNKTSGPLAYSRFHVRAVIEVLISFQVNHNYRYIHLPFFIGLLLALAATARTTPTGRFRARF